jgi:hypothetical protein
MRAADTDAVVKFAGVLAHLLEDSTCPAHALIPMDSPLNLMKDLLPPPADQQKIHLHTVIEHSSPEFDLGSRAPHKESAQGLLDRCYAIVKQNRGNLIEIVRLAYAGDEMGMDRFRLQSAKARAAFGSLPTAMQQPWRTQAERQRRRKQSTGRGSLEFRHASG